jgi:hypothetical protein
VQLSLLYLKISIILKFLSRLDRDSKLGHCHYCPGFWPLDHRWYDGIEETWQFMVWPRYTPLSLTPLPGVRAVPAAQPQPQNPILKIISVKRSSSLYQSFFHSRKLVSLGNKSLLNYSKCTSVKRWLAFDVFMYCVFMYSLNWSLLIDHYFKRFKNS